jgi:fibronectin-binding autotransporter adhesin
MATPYFPVLCRRLRLPGGTPGRIFPALLGGLLAVFLAAPLAAQSTWTGAADASWSNALNWSPAGEPNGQGVIANFTATSPANTSITLGSETLGTLNLLTTTAYSLNGGSLTFDNGAANATITLIAPASGVSTGSFTINSPITLLSDLSLVTPNFANDDTFTFNGTLVSNNHTLYLSGNSSVPIILASSFSGTGALVFTNPNSGVLTLSGTNTYSGGTILQSGTLNLKSSSPLGSGPLVINGSGRLDNLTGAALALSLPSLTLNGFLTYIGSANSLTLAGPVALNGAQTITVSANTLTLSGIIANGSSPGFLTKAGALSTLELDGANTYTGNTTIGFGTLSVSILANAGSPSGIGENSTLKMGTATTSTSTLSYIGTSAASVTNRGISLTGATSELDANGATPSATLTWGNNTASITHASTTINRTFILGGNNTGNNLFLVNLTNPSGRVLNLTKSGSGQWSIGSSSTYTGNTTVNGGTLSLDFSQSTAPATNLLSASAPLRLSNTGELQVVGKSGATNSQTFNGTTFNPGFSTLVATQNGATALNLALGALTRNGTALGDLTAPTAGTFTASGTITGNVVTSSTGTAFVTLGGADWATIVSTNIVPTAYAGTSAVATWSGNNVALATDPDGPASTVSVNTFKFFGSSAATISSGQTLTLSAGGLLVTGTGTSSLSGGTVIPGAGHEIVVVQNDTTNPFTLASSIADNTTATTLTKFGSGELDLNGANTFTGNTNIYAGSVVLGNSLALQNSPLNLVGGSVSVSNSLTSLGLGGLSGSFNLPLPSNLALTLNEPAASFTYSGLLSGSGASVTLTGTGNQTFSGANTYTGPTTIAGGTLVVTHLANGGLPSSLGASTSDPANLVLNGGTLDYTGSAAASTDRGLTLGPAGGTIYILLGTALTFSNTSALVFSSPNTPTTLTLKTNGQNLGFAPSIPDNGSGATSLIVAGPSGSYQEIISPSGSNTYTGPTTVLTGNLVVSSLANGGSPSNLGAASSAAANLVLNSSQLYYTGSGSSTDRLFTIAGTFATLISSGSGPLAFTNPGALAFATPNTAYQLAFEGNAPVVNTFAPLIADNGSGATSVFLYGATWAFSNANTYSGNTTIYASSTLGINNPAALGTGQLQMLGGNIDNTSGAPVTLNTLSGGIKWDFTDATFVGTNSLSLGTNPIFVSNPTGNLTIAANTLTIAGVISTAGANSLAGLSKYGPGTLELDGANTYSGNLSVHAGTLTLHGSLVAATTVTVFAGATLGGHGTASGNVSLAPEAILYPGSGLATFTAGNLTWGGSTTGNATIRATLSNTGNTSSLLNVLGTFTKGAGTSFIFDFQNTGFFDGVTPNTYSLVNFAANSGFSVSDFSYLNLPLDYVGQFALNANSLTFTVSVIPEPATFALLAGLPALVLARRRRSR